MAELNDDQVKDQFKELTDAISEDASNKLLDHQIGRVRRWLRWADKNGYEPSMADLVRQIMHLKISRPHLIAAHAAALWRLAKRKEDDGA